MRLIRAVALALAILITLTALVGCSFDRYNYESFWGVVRWSDDFNGLLVYIPGIGDVDIPRYEKCISSFDGADAEDEENYQIKDGDLVKINFKYEKHWDSHGVEIMECYPARFGMTASSIEVLRQGVELKKIDTGYIFAFTEADASYGIGDTLYIIYHHGYNGVGAMTTIAEGTVTSLEGDKVTLALALHVEETEFLSKYLSSTIESHQE